MDVALAIVWCLCGIVIGIYYIFRIGWRVLRNATGITQRIWGSFIFSCGIGHFVMVYYMAVNPNPLIFHYLVIPVDVLTMMATIEAGHRSPDVPS